jgi:hypothetical protein
MRLYASLGGSDASENAQIMFEFRLDAQQQRVGPSP